MSSDEGTWFELRPDGEWAADAERYRGEAEAEKAATAMLIRRADLEFVAVAEYEVRDGTPSVPGTISRVAAARPPLPSKAAVDDLHKLPRGDPEC
jgi:hypothetical protein